MAENQPEHPDPGKWWRWRRRLSFFAVTVATLETMALLYHVPPAALEHLGAVVAWSYGTWMLLALQYPLGSTVADVASSWAGSR